MAFKNKETKGMRYPAINDLIEKADNKYALVLATAKRAREIVDGEEPLVKIEVDNPVSIATAEIAEDQVRIIDPLENQEADGDEVSFPEDGAGDAPTTEEIAENL
jgi:DNA-directed RNA polymerase subunit omega